MTSLNLTQTLNRFLKPHVPDRKVRQTLIPKLTAQFEKCSFLKYNLSSNIFLILSRDERKIRSLRRYKESPFPLLKNLEGFSIMLGEWNQELQQYNLQSREKLGDHSHNESLVGCQIYISCYDTISSKGNQYLRKQYRRLETYRQHSLTDSYWDLSWTLMLRSLIFRISSLNSWKPLWYKDFTSYDLQRIFQGLNKILNLQELQTQIRNVWIESPKNKWRQLCIPPKSWRLYLHMLNMFITYIHQPCLSSSHHDGFIYNRGCKSWWEGLIWGPYLNQYQNILEVDLSSGFPNLSLNGLRQALIYHGKMPLNLIHLVLQHLKSPLVESQWYPTLESYIENKYNQAWRYSDNSTPMGLGISPILFVLTLDWALKQLKVSNPHLTYKWYADDGSFYFNFKGLIQFLRQRNETWFSIFRLFVKTGNPLLTYLSTNPFLKSIGIYFCPQKSGLVKLWGYWLKPYRSLGLSLYTPWPLYRQLINFQLPVPLDLQGFTRGRGSNPLKHKGGTQSSRTQLNFPSQDLKSNLTYESLKQHYRPYFGLLQSILYKGTPLGPEYPKLRDRKKIYNSLHWRGPRNKITRIILNINPQTIGSKFSEVLLMENSSSLDPLWKIAYPNSRELKFKWEIKPFDLLSTSIPNPLKPPTGLDCSYKKYSELKLSPEELEQCIEEYKLLPRSPNIKPKPY